jgi:tetratricopeptide (TPR) repeat protein
MASALAPGDPQPLISLATECMQAGEHEKAVQSLMKCLVVCGCQCEFEKYDKSSNIHDITENIGICTCNWDGYNHIIKNNQTDNIFKNPPKFPDYGNFPISENSDHNSSSISTPCIPLLLELGNVAYLSQNFTASIYYYRRALYHCRQPSITLPTLSLTSESLESDLSIRVCVNLAHSLRRCDLYLDAYNLYTHVLPQITDNDDISTVYTGMGLCLHSIGDAVNASYLYQRALAIYPDNLMAKSLLGKALAQTVNVPVVAET